jgi:hypothetical protein
VLQTLARQNQLGHAGHLQSIEALRQLHQRGITTGTHIGNDLQHPLVDPVIRDTFPAQQMVQLFAKVRAGGVQSADSVRCCHGNSRS